MEETTFEIPKIKGFLNIFNCKKCNKPLDKTFYKGYHIECIPKNLEDEEIAWNLIKGKVVQRIDR